jgi:hypothetical protein
MRTLSLRTADQPPACRAQAGDLPSFVLDFLGLVRHIRNLSALPGVLS